MSNNNEARLGDNDSVNLVPIVHDGNTQLAVIPISDSVGTGQAGENLAPPRNLQDLLRLTTSLQASSRPSSSQTTEHGGQQPMDVERQQFLKNVLESLSVDVVAFIKERVSSLNEYNINPEQSNPHKPEIAMEELLDQVDSIDMANVFYQVGGLEAIAPLLGSKLDSLRWMAADIIATCCQNNPFCQKLSSGKEVIVALIHMASYDLNLTAKFKAISALSAIVYNNLEGVNLFREHNGFPMVRDALGSANEKIVAKTSYLIMALCDTDNRSKDALFKLGVVEILVSLARLTENLLIENFLRALESITRDHKVSLLECLRKELMLPDYLSSLLVHKASEESYMEIREVAQQLLDRINQVSSQT